MKSKIKKLNARIICFTLLLLVVAGCIPAQQQASAATTNEEIIYEFFVKDMAQNTAVACGVLGNIERESEFSPTASCVDRNGRISYGICQWNGSRFKALKEFAADSGRSYSDIHVQLEFLRLELESTEKNAWSKIKNQPNTADGAYNAGYNWARYFERCASVYYNKSGLLAKNSYWPKYSGKPAPKLVSVESVLGGVRFTWSPVSGATRYRVMRRTSSSGWENIADVSAASYLDKNASSGTTYYYTVRCITSSGASASGFNQNGLSVKYVAAPAIQNMVNNVDGLTVNWNAPKGAVRYRVYRKTSASADWSKIADTSSTTYTDTTAKSGTTYLYMVRCISSDGKSFTSGCYGHGTAAMRLSAPVLTGISSQGGKVTVKWKKVTGASGYNVYRRLPTGNWTLVASLSGGSKVSYVDSAASVGKTYIYTVRAVSGAMCSAIRLEGITVKVK